MGGGVGTIASYAALRKAIAVGKAKEAALYFDTVFPFDLSQQTGPFKKGDLDGYVPWNEGGWDVTVLESLLGDHSLIRHYVNHAVLGHLVKGIIVFQGSPDQIQEIIDGIQPEFFKKEEIGYSTDEVKQILDRYKIGNFGREEIVRPFKPALIRTVSEAGFLNSSYWNTEFSFSDQVSQSSSEIAITLSGLDLVDADMVPWEAILELRKDKASMSDLRDFRLFLTEQQSGREPEHVRDLILSKLEAHKRAAKKWNLDLTQKIFAAVGDGPTMLTTALAGAAITSVGGGLIALGAAVVPLGKVVLEVKNAMVDRDNTKADSQIRYLARIEGLPTGK